MVNLKLVFRGEFNRNMYERGNTGNRESGQFYAYFVGTQLDGQKGEVFLSAGRHQLVHFECLAPRVGDFEREFTGARVFSAH